MYLSFINIKLITKYFIFSVFLILVQAYLPKIFINSNLKISIDLFLIFLTFISFLKKDIYLIIFYAFIIGLLQDFIVNIEIIGCLAFIKSLSVYCIGILKNRDKLWNRIIKITFLYLVYFSHFFIYYYILMNNNFGLIFYLSFIQSLVALLLFYFIEKVFYNSRLI